MTKRSVFIIDDEPDMVKIATDLLQAEDYLVQSAATPSQGLKELHNNPPDLILLDVRLPEMDGFEVCRRIKSDPKLRRVPVIMISVKSDETDVVVGLEIGAEDYITKPFRKRELLARVKTVLRRLDPDNAGQKIKTGPFEVDFGSHTAVVDKKTLSLTPKEFELLGYFLRQEGRVLTRANISEHVWGFEFTHSTRTIDVHVDQLRRKLGKHAECIKGLKGIGYRFEVDD